MDHRHLSRTGGGDCRQRHDCRVCGEAADLLGGAELLGCRLGAPEDGRGARPGVAAANTVHTATRMPPTPPTAVVRLENSVVRVSPAPGEQPSMVWQNSAVSSSDSDRPRSSPLGPRGRE